MRNRIAILLGILMITMSCSKDYLNTAPENQVGAGDVFETTELAAMAVNGVAKLMNTVFYYPDRQTPTTTDFNGEGTIKMLYGNWMGDHFVCSNKDGFGVLFKGTSYMSNTSSVYCYYPWWYYYMVIGNANSIVSQIDDARGPESEKHRIKAQALTFRAYAYIMLSQIYCKRWRDSNGGTAAGVVLRLTDSFDGQKLCTLKELYQQIYDDLDEAIRLFKSSGYEREEKYNHLPDIHVAYATYARTALTREDYKTAASMARDAREGYPLMDTARYQQGFNAVTSEWIWSSCNSGDESIGQFAFFAKIAYNSRISEASKTKCISRELYNQIPATDIRRTLFLDPVKLAYNSATGLAGAELKAKARSLHPDIFQSLPVYAYMQFKFKGNDITGAGDVNHFRSSEMYLIEAEAEYFQGNEKEAREVLVALNQGSGRDEQYSCSKTGQALWNEIKLYRAIELWGEGFDWFDMKRWGDTIDRKSFANGGNFTAKTSFVTKPEENNGWCWLIPQLESDYNPEITK